MSHYYSEKQTSILKLSKIKAELRCGTFEFYTGSGVFSIGRVDKGRCTGFFCISNRHTIRGVATANRRKPK